METIICLNKSVGLIFEYLIQFNKIYTYIIEN